MDILKFTAFNGTVCVFAGEEFRLMLVENIYNILAYLENVRFIWRGISNETFRKIFKHCETQVHEEGIF